MWSKSFAAILLVGASSASQLYEVEDLNEGFDQAGRRLQTMIFSSPAGAVASVPTPLVRNNWSAFGNRCVGDVNVLYPDQVAGTYTGNNATWIQPCMGLGGPSNQFNTYSAVSATAGASGTAHNWGAVVGTNIPTPSVQLFAGAPRIQWSGAQSHVVVPQTNQSTGVPRNPLTVPVYYTIAIVDPDAPYGAGNGRPFGAPVNAAINNAVYALAIDTNVCGIQLQQYDFNVAGALNTDGQWFGHQMSGPGANTVLPYMAPSPPGVPQPAAGAIPPMPSGAGVNNAMLNGRWRAPHRQQIMIYQQPLDLSLALNQATAARASNPANWAPSARNGQCWTTNAPGGIGMGSSSLQRTSVFPQDYLTAGNQVAGIARNAFDLNSFVQRYSLTPQASLSHFVN